MFGHKIVKVVWGKLYVMVVTRYHWVDAGHALQLFVSSLFDHRHSTAAVKYPSTLKVMEAWFCFISPAGRCWLDLLREPSKNQLKLVKASEDGWIVGQTSFVTKTHTWFISVSRYAIRSVSIHVITESLFVPAEVHTCHSCTTGYQSKCITMNILGIIVLEFTDTQVGSKRNVLLC